MEEAGLVLRSCAWALGNDIWGNAIDLKIVKFIRHQSFESILHWIDPDEPFEPRMHLLRRDEVAGINNQCLNSDTSKLSRRV